MSMIEYIVFFFASYSALVCFFCGMIVGQEGILVLSVFSGQGIFDWRVVFIFGYLGLMSVDSLFFFIGRIRQLSHLKKIRFVRNNYEKVISFMHHFSRGNDFFVILSSKFVYGSRLAVSMYMGRRRLSFLRFFVYVAVINFVWICLAVLIGWGTGRGISLFMSVYNGFVFAVSFVVVSLIMYLIVRHFWDK